MNRADGGGIFKTAAVTVLKAVVLTALAMALLALFVTYADVPEQAQNGCITAATVLGVMLAGFSAAHKRRGAGWLSGLIAGAVYFCVIMLAGYLMFGSFSFGAGTVRMFALCVVSAVVGGILGVNIGFRRKK